LNGRMALRLMALLILLKLLAVTTSYASGNAGGIFGPSLFIGAMLGGSLGSIAHHLLPAYTALPGAYALVGMGTLFAGIVRAPMTSVLMIFETTHDYAVIVPLMISNMVSFFIATKLQKEPIYEALAVQDGIHLPGAEVRRLGQREVADVMRSASEVMRSEMTVREALDQSQGMKFQAWPVTNERGVIGLVGLAQLKEAMENGGNRKKIGDMVDAIHFPHVHADQPLYLALERMGAANMNVLPVVSRANIHHLMGIVVLGDVLDSYGVRRS
jgi:chloride channel protein, CIC family